MNSRTDRWKALASEYFKMDLATQARGKMIYCKEKLYTWARWMPYERLFIRLTKALTCQQGNLTVASIGTQSRHRVEDSKFVLTSDLVQHICCYLLDAAAWFTEEQDVRYWPRPSGSRLALQWVQMRVSLHSRLKTPQEEQRILKKWHVMLKRKLKKLRWRQFTWKQTTKSGAVWVFFSAIWFDSLSKYCWEERSNEKLWFLLKT